MTFDPSTTPLILSIARDGRILGEYSLEQINQGAQNGLFLPADDALQPLSSEWVKLSLISGVKFPMSAFPAPTPKGPPAPPLPDQYNGLYRSSDEKVLIGFCGGMAHKFGFQAGVARFILVVTALFTASATFWIYLISAFLPKLPTKNLPRS